MGKKNRRKKHRRGFLTAKATPQHNAVLSSTHFIRLERVKIEVDETLRWYVIRTIAKREIKVQEGLEKAGFATFRPLNVLGVERLRGRTIERTERPAAGYLFVGMPEGKSGPEELWKWHDKVVTGDGPFKALDRDGREIICDARAIQERPFYRIMGPFRSKQLQRFAERIKPRLVAALWRDSQVVATFPSTQFGIVEGETLGLASVAA